MENTNIEKFIIGELEEDDIIKIRKWKKCLKKINIIYESYILSSQRECKNFCVNRIAKYWIYWIYLLVSTKLWTLSCKI